MQQSATDIEIVVPQAPVMIAPGAETRVPVDVHNRSATQISLRLSVAKSRAGYWARLDPPVLALPPGELAAIDVVFRPPADVATGARVQPFTVRADDLGSGIPAAHATGLLTVAAPERLAATLAREADRPGLVEWRLTLTNRTGTELPLTVLCRAVPLGGAFRVTPAAVLVVPAGRTVEARVRWHPRVPLFGPSARYSISIRCRESGTADGTPPAAEVTDGGVVTPLLPPRVAAVLAAALACALLLGWGLHLMTR